MVFSDLDREPGCPSVGKGSPPLSIRHWVRVVADARFPVE